MRLYLGWGILIISSCFRSHIATSLLRWQALLAQSTTAESRLSHIVHWWVSLGFIYCGSSRQPERALFMCLEARLFFFFPHELHRKSPQILKMLTVTLKESQNENAVFASCAPLFSTLVRTINWPNPELK